MPRIVVLAQAVNGTGKALVIGAFTQRKKVWHALELLEHTEPTPTCEKLADLVVQDDVLQTTLPALYRHLCAILRQNGRVVLGRLVGGEFVRAYLLVEGELNQLRAADLDADGKPQPCPLKGGEAEEPDKATRGPEEIGRAHV